MIDYRKNSELFVYEGVMANIVGNITTGAFMTGYAKYLGADDRLCGILLATNSFAALIQLFGPYIYEKFQFRKAFIVISALIGRILLSLTVLIPLFVYEENARVTVLFISYVTAFICIHFHAPAAINWIMSLVPEKMRGKYFGRRDSQMLVICTLTNLILGFFMDKFKSAGREYTGYTVVFGVVFFCAVADIIILSLIKEPKVSVRTVKDSVTGEYIPAGLNFKQLIIVPLLHKEFRKIILMMFLWTVAVMSALPYFSVYRVAVLQLDYTFIMICNLILMSSMMIMSRIWGKIGDKKGWMFVVKSAMTILAAVHISWFFIDGGNVHVFNPVIEVFSGIAWSGINISLFNIPYLYTPQKAKTVYLGFSSALAGGISLFTTVSVAMVVKLMGEGEFSFAGIKFVNMQILFVFSGLMILGTVLYISKMGAKKEVVRKD